MPAGDFLCVPKRSSVLNGEDYYNVCLTVTWTKCRINANSNNVLNLPHKEVGLQCIAYLGLVSLLITFRSNLVHGTESFLKGRLVRYRVHKSPPEPSLIQSTLSGHAKEIVKVRVFCDISLHASFYAQP
jgi:hypothetical protein